MLVPSCCRQREKKSLEPRLGRCREGWSFSGLLLCGVNYLLSLLFYYFFNFFFFCSLGLFPWQSRRRFQALSSARSEPLAAKEEILLLKKKNNSSSKKKSHKTEGIGAIWAGLRCFCGGYTSWGREQMGLCSHLSMFWGHRAGGPCLPGVPPGGIYPRGINGCHLVDLTLLPPQGRDLASRDPSVSPHQGRGVQHPVCHPGAGGAPCSRLCPDLPPGKLYGVRASSFPLAPPFLTGWMEERAGCVRV